MAHLNIKYNTQPSDTPEEVPYFHFINLVEENPDASIKSSMFVNDDYPVKLSN